MKTNHIVQPILLIKFSLLSLQETETGEYL